MTQNAINTTVRVAQVITSSSSALHTCSTAIPVDDTIPQNTEGNEVLTASITPTTSTSTLEIYFNGPVCKDTNAGWVLAALFQDSTANALSATATKTAASRCMSLPIKHIMTSGTTSSTTFKIRVGPDANSCYVNGNGSGTRLMGGVSSCTLIIVEYV